ncbi:AraC family transcriptional regulator [Paenibacillus dokdonensis]|uniref:AraC family transcriptional regulator n=1 Tax=Paenibacillus dokdonensis TaxID=2567944 RepID=UPI0010A89D79|nr:AraC family transcriptional regulator [Paenibacillus dokdonensis]
MKGITNKLGFSRSLFRKMLLSYMATILIPSLLILAVYAYTLKEDLLSQMEESSNASMQRVSANVETIINQINGFSLQLSFLPDINNLLKQPDTFTMYDYYQLKEQLRTQIVSNSLFESAYLYVSQNGKMLTTNEGLFDALSFYDQDVMKEVRSHTGESLWYKVRQAPANPNPSAKALDFGEWITFYKSVPVTSSKPLGTLVLNIPKSMFLQTLSNMNGGNDSHILIMDSSGSPISSSRSEDSGNLSQLAMQSTAGVPGTPASKIRWNDELYFAHIHTIPLNDWKVINLVPYSDYESKLFDKLSRLLLILLFVCFVGLAISYLFAALMYNPWKKVLAALSHTSDKLLRSTSGSRQMSDEVTIVNSAIRNMIHTIRENEPIIRNYLIADILRGNISDKESIPMMLEQAGISFPHPDYMVIVAVLDGPEPPVANDSDNPQTTLVLFSMISDTLKLHMQAEGTILSGSKLGFIVNISPLQHEEDLKETVRECYSEMSAMIQEQLHMTLRLCVGDICPPAGLHISYGRIQSVLNYKAVMNSRDVIFVHARQTNPKFVYPISFQKQLIHSITSLDLAKIEEGINNLFQRYIYNSKYPHEKLQSMVMALMGGVMNELIREGYDLESLNEGFELFELHNCQNNEELHRFMTIRMVRIVEAMQSIQERPVINLYVSEAITYMEEKYAENISITDIAEHVGISSGHLSRTFKAEMGRSMLEYLTEYRLSKSKERLANRHDSLQCISQSVGYNDVQSFIRFFKKYEGVTPGEYRKNLFKS